MRNAILFAVLMITISLSLPAAFADETYYGADVQVDSLGDAALLMGDISIRHGATTVRIALDPLFQDAHPGAQENVVETHPGAPEAISTFHPGAPERALEHCRSVTVPVLPGDLISLGVSLMSDAHSLSNLSAHTARIIYDIDLIDSLTGNVLLSMIHVSVGNGPLVSLPPVNAKFLYDGRASVKAFVAMRARVENIDPSLFGVEGLIVYAEQLAKPGLAKSVNDPAQLPVDAVEIAPNPAHAWTQLTYGVQRPGNVRVEIYDRAGRRVAQPVDSFLNAGRYTAGLNAESFPAGEYYVRVMQESVLVGVANLVVRR